MNAVTTHRFTHGPDSPLDGVASPAWRRFIGALEVQPVGQVSDSGGLGAYDLRPRRLVELGYAKNLRALRLDARQVQACDLVKPWTKERFLKDPIAQYTVLAMSMRAYYDALRSGEIVKPKDVSVSGALAVLHVGGRGALVGWPKLFDNTRALYERCKGMF